MAAIKDRTKAQHRRVTLLRLAAALNEEPEPNRALRRAAARTARRKGSK